MRADHPNPGDDATVRTTVTLDPDTDALVRRLMRERGLGVSQAVNAAIRAGITPRRRRRTLDTSPLDMGSPSIAIDRALQLAAELENDELRRKLTERR